MSQTNQPNASNQAKAAHENQVQNSGQAQGSSVISTFGPEAAGQKSATYDSEADISKSLIIKGGSLFMLLDSRGDADVADNAAHGLYFHDCRFLSKSTLQLGQQVLTPRLNSDAEDEIANFELVNSAVILEEAPGVSPSPPS